MDLAGRYQRLQQIVSQYRSVAIAFSGGVDSALLLKVACDTLGCENVLALTATSPIFPTYEIEQSQHLARRLGVAQKLIKSQQLELQDFSENGIRRCYHCKLSLFSQFLATLEGTGMVLLEGSNLDDLDDYRPGREAIQQLQISSPLLEAQLNKQDVRQLSRQLGLPTWDKPSGPCLATRFPYGNRITVEKLKQVELCEHWLRQQGFSNFRVRNHQQLARIEVPAADISRFNEPSLREKLINFFKAHQFDYITIDLQGYRSGSMDELLPDKNCSDI